MFFISKTKAVKIKVMTVVTINKIIPFSKVHTTSRVFMNNTCRETEKWEEK